MHTMKQSSRWHARDASGLKALSMTPKK